jgi:hypothetical protein
MSQTLHGPLRKLLILLGRAGRKAVLHPAESIVLIRMAAWVIVLSISVKLTSLPGVLQLISVRASGRPAVDPATAAKLANAVDLLLASDVLCFRPSCWKRTLILHRYLALSGIESRIKFGVRKDANGKLVGHAWLECDGEPILEASVPAYAVTLRFPTEVPVPR